jgi:D-alanyl-D-alanine carboxypeptidase (penicillin-binding protein 5/6)
MVLKRLVYRIIMAVLLWAAVLTPAYPAAAVDDIFLTARHALLIDVMNHDVLYAKAAGERAFPASLTKIMTSLLIFEYVENGGSLDEIVTATPSALAGVSPHGSRINPPLRVGEEMPLRDLLYAIIIPSANDACDVVAEHISGSVEAFVELMNRRAAEMGLEGTRFMNTHGMHHPNHYTTAWDVYRMVRAAMEYPLYLEICHTESRTIAATNLTPERVLHTTNHLITRRRFAQYVYAPAVGIKTGLTSAAGYCLVTTAEQGSLRLISIVMGAEGPHINTGAESYPHNDSIMSFMDTRQLMQWGFANFERRVLLPERDVVGEVPVRMGIGQDSVRLWTAGSIEAVVPRTLDLSSLRRVIEHEYPDGIDAPVVRGQIMGTLTLRAGLCKREETGYAGSPCTVGGHCGCIFGVTELIASANIDRSQAAYMGVRIQETVQQPWVRYAVFSAGGLIVLYVAYVIILNRFRRGRKRERSYRGSKRKHKR